MEQKKLDAAKAKGIEVPTDGPGFKPKTQAVKAGALLCDDDGYDPNASEPKSVDVAVAEAELAEGAKEEQLALDVPPDAEGESGPDECEAHLIDDRDDELSLKLMPP